MADKDLEINNYQEKVQWLESRVLELQNQLETIEIKHKEDLSRLGKETPQKNHTVESIKDINNCSNVR